MQDGAHGVTQRSVSTFIVDSGWLGRRELRGGLLSRVSTAGMGSRLHGNDDSSWIVGVLGVAWRASVAGIHGGDGFPSARERRFIVDGWGVGSYAEGSCRGYRRRGWVPVCTGTTIHRGWLGRRELRGGLLKAGIHGGDGFPSARERRALAHPLDARGSNPEPLDCGNRVPFGNNGYSDLHQDHQEASPWRAITGASPRRCRSTG